MNIDMAFIRDEKDFKETEKLIMSVFKTECRFPRQVLNDSFTSFVFEVFDWTMSPEFWKTIQYLALESGDSYVIAAVLEPNPTTYYRKEFGYYNWFKISCSSTCDDYWSILAKEPEGSPADAILYNSEVVVWLSPSIKWAIWGERSSENCVYACQKESLLDKNLSILQSWRSVNLALTELFPTAFYPQKVPRDFASTLLRNYSVSLSNI